MLNNIQDIAGALRELFFYPIAGGSTPTGGRELASRKNPELRVLLAPSLEEDSIRFYFTFDDGGKMIYVGNADELDFQRLEALVEYVLANRPKHAAGAIRISASDLEEVENRPTELDRAISDLRGRLVDVGLFDAEPAPRKSFRDKLSERMERERDELARETPGACSRSCSPGDMDATGCKCDRDKLLQDLATARRENDQEKSAPAPELGPGSLRGIYAAQVAAEGSALPIESGFETTRGEPAPIDRIAKSLNTARMESPRSFATIAAEGVALMNCERLLGILDKYPGFDPSRVTPFEESDLRAIEEGLKRSHATERARAIIAKLERLQELEASLKVVCRTREEAAEKYLQIREIANTQTALPLLDCFIALLEKFVELKLRGE